MTEQEQPPVPEPLRALARDYRAIQAPPYLAERALAEARGRARRHPLAWGATVAAAILVAVIALPLLRAPLAPEPGVPGFTALNDAGDWLTRMPPHDRPGFDALSDAAAISSLAELPDLSV